MAEARGRDNWAHTSAMLAFICNSNPFRSGRPVTPASLNPWPPLTLLAGVKAPVQPGALPLAVLLSAMLVKQGHKPLPATHVT
jgi:hypothetical protein